MSRSWLLPAVLAALLSPASALLIPHEDVFHDHDLFSYVTMPDVKVPRFNVSVNHTELVSPGYWFVAPYTAANPVNPIEDYKPHQIGPMIYDNAGELIWSGAHLFKDRSVFDFRATQVNGKPHLSFIVNYDPASAHHKTGTAMVLDPSYQVYHEMELGVSVFNMHEFNVVDDGASALVITTKVTSAEYMPNTPKRRITDNGFKEVDLLTGKKLFEWSALGHINPWDSQLRMPYTSSQDAWDFVHLNSVTKSKLNGDYIISARYTDTIYRISAVDGSIVWKFGGKNNSFEMSEGFRFLAQHDARIIDEYNSTLILSFLNNAADDTRRIRPYSCGYIAALNTDTMTAQLLHTFDRPDHATTHGRGNIQVLPNSNVFANWADNGYFSEHTLDGDVIWQAQFSSKRYVTYRAYKFEFEGNPVERPAIEAHASVTADAKITTVFHVSWNGATRVHAWNFYSCKDDNCEKPTLIGSTQRTGFETMFTGAGLHRTVFAEAVDVDGQSLAESLLTNITLSVLPVLDEADSYGQYSAVMPHLLVLAFVAMTITVFWVFVQRRRFKSPYIAWKDPEKQGYWNSF